MPLITKCPLPVTPAVLLLPISSKVAGVVFPIPTLPLLRIERLSPPVVFIKPKRASATKLVIAVVLEEASVLNIKLALLAPPVARILPRTSSF